MTMTPARTISLSTIHNDDVDDSDRIDGVEVAGGRAEADVAMARRMLQSLRCREDQRRSRVERLKEAIRSNSYENPLKLSVALDRMLDDAWAARGE